MSLAKIQIPNITEEEMTPIISQLLEIIEQLSAAIQQQTELIQQLKDEIARLKGHSPKPKIRPSRLGKNIIKKKKGSGKKKRPGSKKRHKTAQIQIHETIAREPDYIPPGSKFKGYNDFVVQGLEIKAHNVLFRLKTYEAPDGEYITAKLPKHLNGKHFNPELIEFILYQYHHCHVTQPLLLEQLYELGIDISKGKLNNILIEDKDEFHQEKNEILTAGLEVSSYISVDDTGARHNGKNGYCTHIGNDLFSWFESTESKSRINFLKLLRAGHSDYLITMDAIAYMQSNKLPKYAIKAIIANLHRIFANDSQWHAFLAENDIVKQRHIQIATEGALIGAILEHGISEYLVIISDDAGQFNVLLHALCWIHANRAIDKIIPYTEQAKIDLKNVKDQIWKLYEGLKAYKQNPNLKDKNRLEAFFDQIFTTHTSSAMLNLALGRIYKNKSELLLVLERPDIPLHNNLSENSIREYVKRRKVSGSTRSESGRMCRDTFTTLKKTCRKLGVPFWQYLKDRIEKIGHIPKLSDLIRQQALNPG